MYRLNEAPMTISKTDKTSKRLSLTRETLRTLTKDELRLVAGGRAPSPPTYALPCAR